jgi:RNA polymerase sigma factor (sigma-70 family)
MQPMHREDPSPGSGRPLTPDEWLGLYRQLVPEFFRCVSRRLGADRALAEDIVQEAWLRALGAWRSKGPPEDPGAWLRAAAFNLARNHFRRVAPERLDDARTPDAAPSAECDARARVALVQWGLARLGTAHAELLSARHLDGLSLAQLAHARGTTERAIEGRLRRARQALAAVLRGHGPRRHAGGAPSLDPALDVLLGDMP